MNNIVVPIFPLGGCISNVSLEQKFSTLYYGDDSHTDFPIVDMTLNITKMNDLMMFASFYYGEVSYGIDPFKISLPLEGVTKQYLAQFADSTTTVIENGMLDRPFTMKLQLLEEVGKVEKEPRFHMIVGVIGGDVTFTVDAPVDVNWGDGRVEHFPAGVATGTPFGRIDVSSDDVVTSFTFEPVTGQQVRSATILRALDLVSIAQMCRGMHHLNTFELDDAPKLIDTQGLFRDTPELIAVLGNFGNITNMGNIFMGSGIVSLDINTRAAENMNDMVNGATRLQCIQNLDTRAAVALGQVNNLFTNTPALRFPDATEQADILTGVRWENTHGLCKDLVYHWIKDMIFNNANMASEFPQSSTGELISSKPDDVVTGLPVTSLVTPHSDEFRYVRDWMEGSSVSASNHWMELKVLNDVGVNIAGGITPTSNHALTTPQQLTDGIANNNSNRANGPTTGLFNQYVQVDLGALHHLSTVVVWHYYDGARTFHKTKTEVSKDGVTWFTVFDSALSGEYAEQVGGHSIDASNVMLGNPTKHYDILPMAVNSEHGQIATASSVLGSSAGDKAKAFNRTVIDANDCWHSANNTTSGHWLKLQVPKEFIPVHWKLTGRVGDTAYVWGADKFTLLGSMDDNTWETLAIWSGTKWGEGEVIEGDINTPNTFKYFKIQIDKGHYTNYVIIGDFYITSKAAISGDKIIGVASVLNHADFGATYEYANIVEKSVVKTAPIATQTSDTAPEKVTSSALYSTSASYKAFHAFQNTTSYLGAKYGNLPFWVKIEMRTAIQPSHFVLKAYSNISTSYVGLKDYKIQASNDEVTWDDLIVRTGDSWSGNQVKQFTLDDTSIQGGKTYRYFRLYGSAMTHSGNFRFRLPYFGIHKVISNNATHDAFISAVDVNVGDELIVVKADGTEHPLTVASVQHKSYLDPNATDPFNDGALKAKWRFNGGGTKDKLGNYDGTFSGGAGVVAGGYSGNYLKTTGNSHSIMRVPDLPNDNIFTFAGRIKVGGVGFVIGDYTTGWAGCDKRIRVSVNSGGKVHVEGGQLNGGVTLDKTVQGLIAGEWVHFAVVANLTTHTIKGYIDGEHVGDASNGGFKNTGMLSCIGASLGSQSSSAYYYPTEVDELEYYTGEVSADNIKRLALVGTPPKTVVDTTAVTQGEIPKTAYFPSTKLEMNVGGRWYDAVETSHHVTYDGDDMHSLDPLSDGGGSLLAKYMFDGNANDLTSVHNGSDGGLSYESGKFDNAIKGFTATQRVGIVPAIDLNNKDWTIATNLKVTAIKDENYFAGAALASAGIGSPNHSLHLGWRTVGQFTVAFYGDDIDYAVPEKVGEYQSIIIRFKASTKESELIVNGLSIGKFIHVAAYQGTFGTIGSTYRATVFFAGVVDQTEVFNKCISDAEVAILSSYRPKALRDTVKYAELLDRAGGKTEVIPRLTFKNVGDKLIELKGSLVQ